MEELSYSLHLSNDKNKSKKARRSVKNTETGTITKKDNDEIIKKYYAFEEIKETNKSNIKPIKKQDIVNNKSKENLKKIVKKY